MYTINTNTAIYNVYTVRNYINRCCILGCDDRSQLLTRGGFLLLAFSFQTPLFRIRTSNFDGVQPDFRLTLGEDQSKAKNIASQNLDILPQYHNDQQ